MRFGFRVGLGCLVFWHYGWVWCLLCGCFLCALVTFGYCYILYSLILLLLFIGFGWVWVIFVMGALLVGFSFGVEIVLFWELTACCLNLMVLRLFRDG